MELWEEIKERVSMKDLLESYGIYPERGTNIYKCCFHNDAKPSANIVRGCQKFHCFAENKTWDVFDFVQDIERCDLKTAVKLLDERFNLGLLHELTHKEKIELARQRRERERQKAEKLAWERYEKIICSDIIKNLRLWEQAEKDTHLTRREYRLGTWSEKKSSLFFKALERQRWLNWLYERICGFSDKKECEYDYMYPSSKRKLLEMIKSNEIEI